MKIRNGFVSNSSSSSFIIQFKEDHELVESLTGMRFSILDFFDYLRSSKYYNCDTEMYELTFDLEERKNLINYIDENLVPYASNEEKQKLIKLTKEIKNKKNNFARFDISEHDKLGNFIFRLMEQHKFFDIKYSSID